MSGGFTEDWYADQVAKAERRKASSARPVDREADKLRSGGGNTSPAASREGRGGGRPENPPHQTTLRTSGASHHGDRASPAPGGEGAEGSPQPNSEKPRTARGGDRTASSCARAGPGGEGPAGGSPRLSSKRKLNRPEEGLQKTVAAFLDWALPEPYRWLHIPNQKGTRKTWENRLLKALGVKEGAADCLILGPRFPFIWIELKAEKGSLSKAQRDWRDWCKRIGAPWFLCRTLEAVIAALQSLQIRLRARPA